MAIFATRDTKNPVLFTCVGEEDILVTSRPEVDRKINFVQQCGRDLELASRINHFRIVCYLEFRDWQSARGASNFIGLDVLEPSQATTSSSSTVCYKAFSSVC
jgi:hypothetical protein